MKRMIWVFASMCIAIGVVCAGGRSEPDTDEAASGAITVTDDSGVVHTFDAPRRAPSCGGVECIAGLAALGIRPHSVWGDYYSDPEIGALAFYYGEEAERVIVIPDDDFEALAAVAPDIVFLYEYEREAIEVTAPLYALNYSLERGVEQGVADITDMAAILGVPAEEARARIDALVARVDAYAARSPRDREAVILMEFGNSDDPAELIVMGTACGFLSRFAPCPASTPEGYYESLTMEGLVSLDPDILFFAQAIAADTPVSATLAALEDNALWSEVAAVRAQEMHELPLVFWPTHLLSAANWLDRYMPRIYPDTFSNGPLTDEEVREIVAEGRAE